MYRELQYCNCFLQVSKICIKELPDLIPKVMIKFLLLDNGTSVAYNKGTLIDYHLLRRDCYDQYINSALFKSVMLDEKHD